MDMTVPSWWLGSKGHSLKRPAKTGQRIRSNSKTLKGKSRVDLVNSCSALSLVLIFDFEGEKVIELSILFLSRLAAAPILAICSLCHKRGSEVTEISSVWWKMMNYGVLVAMVG